MISLRVILMTLRDIHVLTDDRVLLTTLSSVKTRLMRRNN
nr:MAG TPA: hypothetical protein [Caudoviricetes sp.]